MGEEDFISYKASWSDWKCLAYNMNLPFRLALAREMAKVCIESP